MAEEISFELKSNLDVIAKEAKVLAQNIDKVYYSFKRKNTALLEQNRLESESVEGVDALQESYDDLRTQVEKVTGSKKRLAGVITNTGNNLEGLRNKINSSNDDWKNGPQNWKMNDEGISSSFEKIMKKVREFENGVQKSILKINNAVYNMGVNLTANATNLKPFDLTFMSSFSFNPKQFFGFGGAMKEAFELMKTFQQMRHELASLSDSSGNASKALGLVYDIAGNSSVASATAMSAMRALGDQGILTDDKRFRDLGILSGDLQAATGIAASQWGAFTGELAFNYGLPVEGLENITSALIGTNLRGAQLEKAMQTVNKILQNTAFIAGKPTKDSIEGLTKSVGGAMKTFQAMGISAEKAGGFIEGIVDPENFEKNSFLFAKLGISASDYADTLNDVNGQQKLLDRVMGNLPKLASEITNIKNPFARLQFAKTLGLDMQIVRNMAGKTQSEIEEMIAKYQKENQAKEALEAKRKAMAAEAAKFDDMMLGLRLKVLKPVMQFLTKGYLNNFIAVLPKIAITIGSIFEAMTPIIESVTTTMLELIPVVTSFVEKFVNPFIKMFPQIIDFLLNKLQPYLGLLTRDESVLGDGKGNSSSTNKITTVAFNILKLLGQIYLFIIGWKALNLVADGFFKFTSLLMPGKKTLMSTSLDEYIRRMAQIQKGGGRGGGFWSSSSPMFKMMVGAAVASLAIFGLRYGLKKILPESMFSNVPKNKRKQGEFYLNKEGIFNRATERIVFMSLPKSMGGTGLRQLIRSGTSTSSMTMKEKFFDFFKTDRLRTSESIGKRVRLSTKVLETAKAPVVNVFNIGGKMLKTLGTLGAVTSVARLISAENYQEFYGAIGGTVGGFGAMKLAAPFITKLKHPLAIAVASVLTFVVGETLGDSIGQVIGYFKDQNVVALNTSGNLVRDLTIGMNNIFGAFNLQRMDIIAEEIVSIINSFINKIGDSMRKSVVMRMLFDLGEGTMSKNAVEGLNTRLSVINADRERILKEYRMGYREEESGGRIPLRKENLAGEIERLKIANEASLNNYFAGGPFAKEFAALGSDVRQKLIDQVKSSDNALLLQILQENKKSNENIKTGNKQDKEHYNYQKERDNKTEDEKIISSFKFDSTNINVFSGYTITD